MNKTVLLALMASISLNVDANRSRNTDDKEYTCKRTCCTKPLTTNECSPIAPNRSFDCCLSFEQTAITDMGTDVFARPIQDKPSDVCGRLKLCFSEDFSQLQFELTITGLDIENFPNQRPLGAWLCLGTAGENTTSKNIDIFSSSILSLCGLDNPGDDLDGCTTPNAICNTTNKGTFCCKGTLTNENIINTTPLDPQTALARAIPTLAALFQAIRAGQIFAIVNGGNNCSLNDADPKYGLRSGGLIRCQILNNEVVGTLTTFS